MAQFIGRCIYGLINLFIAFPIPMTIIVLLICIVLIVKHHLKKTIPQSNRIVQKK